MILKPVFSLYLIFGLYLITSIFIYIYFITLLHIGFNSSYFNFSLTYSGLSKHKMYSSMPGRVSAFGDKAKALCIVWASIKMVSVDRCGYWGCNDWWRVWWLVWTIFVWCLIVKIVYWYFQFICRIFPFFMKCVAWPS